MEAKMEYEEKVRPENMPTIPAIEFLGIQNGKHRCRAIIDVSAPQQ
jgi:hypothetical protein